MRSILLDAGAQIALFAVEVGNALSRFARTQASLIIRHFQNADEVTLIALNPTLFNTAMHWYDKYHDKTWGWVDCVSFAVMTEMRLSRVLSTGILFKRVFN
ncbi:MAG: hypothetical protein H6969_06795 [Gammaproteobacteria bacterium]|nr:hypothetical protein [Gammaproteobacteria bacterium]